jgi:adenylate cyclase
MNDLSNSPDTSADPAGDDSSQEPCCEPSWSNSSTASWLATHNGTSIGAGALLGELCEKLVATGIPLDRVNMALDDHHPQVAVRGFMWAAGEGVEEVAFPFGTGDSTEYQDSPIRVIREGGASGIRQRLDGPDASNLYGVMLDLRNDGFTDYAAMPLRFSDGTIQFISWATKIKDGFTTEQLGELYDLLSLMCMRFEIDHSHLVTRTLLQTYHGRQASERILSGTIRRNQGERLASILVYSDLRGFTRLADRHPAEDVTRALGEYYEAVAAPIEARGGDIIKMIGDGILALFTYVDPMMGPCENTQACEAVEAVLEAHRNLESLGPADLPGDIEELRAGFALHTGTVTFGNVGSSSRLDFTAIGPAVNEVARVEPLTKILGAPILATSRFAKLECAVEMSSLGFHELRGVREPQEIFTLKEFVSG